MSKPKAVKAKRLTRAERLAAIRARRLRRRERAYERAAARASAVGSLAPRERLRLFLRAHFPHMGKARREALANQFAGAEPVKPAGAPEPAVTLDTEVDA